MIQSAVNLKLVHRAAEQAHKHLVIVTNNPALSALAASAGIPIAKNLQSKPEMPELTALNAEGEDIIDGDDAPVKAAEPATATSDADEDFVMGELPAESTVAEKSKDEPSKKGAAPAGKRAKIPNFDTFRKNYSLVLQR